MYSNIVLRVFNNPANTGRISKPDGIADMYNSNETAHIEFSLRVENDIITDCKFRAQANPYIIAICSTITSMVKGKMISMIFLDPYGVEEQLGEHADQDIMFCIDCLKLAIDDYRIKAQKKGESIITAESEDQEVKEISETKEDNLEESKARLENVFNLLNIKPSEEETSSSSEESDEGFDSLDDFNLFDDDDFGEDF